MFRKRLRDSSANSENETNSSVSFIECTLSERGIQVQSDYICVVI